MKKISISILMMLLSVMAMARTVSTTFTLKVNGYTPSSVSDVISYTTGSGTTSGIKSVSGSNGSYTLNFQLYYDTALSHGFSFTLKTSGNNVNFTAEATSGTGYILVSDINGTVCTVKDIGGYNKSVSVSGSTINVTYSLKTYTVTFNGTPEGYGFTVKNGASKNGNTVTLGGTDITASNYTNYVAANDVDGFDVEMSFSGSTITISYSKTYNVVYSGTPSGYGFSVTAPAIKQNATTVVCSELITSSNISSYITPTPVAGYNVSASVSGSTITITYAPITYTYTVTSEEDFTVKSPAVKDGNTVTIQVYQITSDNWENYIVPAEVDGKFVEVSVDGSDITITYAEANIYHVVYIPSLPENGGFTVKNGAIKSGNDVALVGNTITASNISNYVTAIDLSAYRETITINDNIITITYTFIGETIDNLLDGREFYLYNVGTKQYVNFGHDCGTVGRMYEVGMPLQLVSSGASSNNGQYRLKSNLHTGQGDSNESNYFALHGSGNNNPYLIYVDRPTTGNSASSSDRTNNVNLEITRVEGAEGNCYTIRFYTNGNRRGYWRAVQHTSGNGDTENILYDANTSTTIDDNAKWQFFTIDDLIEEFKDTYARPDDPADATFLIKDPSFYRGWNDNDLTGTWDGSAIDHTFYRTGRNLSEMGNTTPAEYFAAINTEEGEFKNTQTINIPRAGWYKLSCQGVYVGDNTARVIAYVKDKEDEFNTSENAAVLMNYTGSQTNFNTEDKAKGIAQEMYRDSEKYYTCVYLYVPTNNVDVVIGVKSDDAIEANSILYDNFQLKYLGEDIVLDEAWETTDNWHYDEDKPNRTLILKKTMNSTEWTSICLPVDLTAFQFKNGFGQTAKLAELSTLDHGGQRIIFDYVDLTDNSEVVVEAGKAYLMRTEKEGRTGTYQSLSKDQIVVEGPYYIIERVSLPQDAYQTITPVATIDNEDDADDHVNMIGTLKYWKKDGVNGKVMGGQPVYTMNAGTLTYYSKGVSLKGFRAYLYDTDSKNQVKTVARTGSISIEDAIATAIVDIEANDENVVMTRAKNASIYDLSGRKVNAENLSEGMYIINGKKVFIK